MNTRRMFLTRLGAGVGVMGAAVARRPIGGSSVQRANALAAEPVTNSMTGTIKSPAKHRLFFDTITPEGLATGMQFASNFFEANKTGYGLQDSDVAVIMVVRHKSTTFGYNDVIWAKYSAQLSKQANDFLDPARPRKPPIVNVYATSGGRMDQLLKRGCSISPCARWPRSRLPAASPGRPRGNADEIFAEPVCQPGDQRDILYLPASSPSIAHRNTDTPWRTPALKPPTSPGRRRPRGGRRAGLVLKYSLPNPFPPGLH